MFKDKRSLRRAITAMKLQTSKFRRDVRIDEQNLLIVSFCGKDNFDDWSFLAFLAFSLNPTFVIIWLVLCNRRSLFKKIAEVDEGISVMDEEQVFAPAEGRSEGASGGWG